MVPLNLQHLHPLPNKLPPPPNRLVAHILPLQPAVLDAAERARVEGFRAPQHDGLEARLLGRREGRGVVLGEQTGAMGERGEEVGVRWSGGVVVVVVVVVSTTAKDVRNDVFGQGLVVAREGGVDEEEAADGEAVIEELAGGFVRDDAAE